MAAGSRIKHRSVFPILVFESRAYITFAVPMLTSLRAFLQELIHTHTHHTHTHLHVACVDFIAMAFRRATEMSLINNIGILAIAADALWNEED